jgi:hypothetical protein
VDECLRFLGVPRGTTAIALESAQNPTHEVGWVGRKLNQLEIAFPGLRAVLKSAVPGRIKKHVFRVKAGAGPIPKMAPEDRRFLVEYFREKNANLERLIGRPLDGWRR